MNVTLEVLGPVTRLFHKGEIQPASPSAHDPPRFLIAALAATAFLASPAQANLIVSHGTNSLSLFTDSGTKILDYSTTLANPQAVTTDNSGHVYVAEWGTGAYNGNVKMYDIASGEFIRDILPPNLYAPTGVAFNPAHPDEIIVIGEYGAGVSQLGRWFTSATGVPAAANSVGAPYAGLYYNPTIPGGAPEGIYAAAPGGAVQQYNSSTLNWGSLADPQIPDIYPSAPNGITGIGNDLYFSSNTGIITKYSGGVLTPLNINPGGDYYYGITTDGTDLWVAQYGTGFAARYDTSGALKSYFAAPYAVGIAYTTINFDPSAYPIVVNNPSFENGFTGDPTTGWANAEGGTWGSPYIPGSELSPPADGLAVGFGNGGTAYQIITSHTILAGTYTILVDVGRRNDGYYTPFSMAVFSVNGPGGGQPLGGYSLAADPPVGGWSTLTATITIANGDPAIGGNLQLNLDSPGVQTVIDNVRISYAAPSQMPTLTIQQVPGSQVRLAWPTSALGWTLETSTSLLPGSWTDSASTITVEGAENAVYEPISGKRFYRLYK